jgi:transketolase
MLEPRETDNLAVLVRQARARLLQMHFESGVGHIGGNLSCLDMLMVLHHRGMRAEDVFVLSKGHAAGALYVTLWSRGILTDADLQQFHRDGTRLSGHPAPCWRPEICFATGSLGHGLGLSAGIALGKRLQNQPGRVFCLLSDGEWQEGSNWESLIFCAHHRLPVTLLLDANGLQGFGTTAEVAGMEPLAAKFEAFDVPTTELDGHDLDAITQMCSKAVSGPQVLIAHTRKGGGVSFMENRLEWHYLPMTATQYQQALEEVEHS